MKTITVIARKWFNKSQGNTYHSVEVYLDGYLLGSSGVVYGYGSQWKETAKDILAVNDIKPYGYLYVGYNLVESCSNVATKKDLTPAI